METRNQFGLTPAAGSTDDPRLHHITQHLSPVCAPQLFDAHADQHARD